MSKSQKPYGEDAVQQPDYLAQALLLEGIGRPPITFHRVFVDIAGGVLPALWLSYALYQDATVKTQDFIEVESSGAACEEATGITRAQQKTCRRTLSSALILSEHGSQGKRLSYRIETAKIMELLKRQAQGLAERLADADRRLDGNSPPESHDHSTSLTSGHSSPEAAQER